MKVLFDTNLLIHRFRNPARAQELDWALDRSILFMSSVVAMELFAGCHTRSDIRDLEHFLRPFEKGRRWIVPDHGHYAEAGRVLAAIGRDLRIAPHDRAYLANDVLIATSAARNGVAVITANTTDFEVIQRYVPLTWFRSPGEYLAKPESP